ncbi:MAG: TerC family protein [Phycisphaerales bacterium]|nr:TerC family protein [Phycisphaerales bacterium]
MDFAAIFTPENLVALFTLTALEVVLGIDNIIFIAILVGRLPEHQRDKARTIGLALAMFMRIALLLAITWVMKLDKYTLFELPWGGGAGGHAGHGGSSAANLAAATMGAAMPNTFTGKDLVLFVGGLFLVAKSVYEIHHKIEDAGGEGHREVRPVPTGGDGKAASGGYVKQVASNFGSAIAQILMLDLVFSLDSVITAVGMAKALWVMIAAVVIAVGVMLAVSGSIARFVERHPTVKMLALAFLILIGVMLVAESSGTHIPKGYIYFAMAFALGVEMLNIWGAARRKRTAAAAA